jgi:hypothetical protein
LYKKNDNKPSPTVIIIGPSSFSRYICYPLQWFCLSFEPAPFSSRSTSFPDFLEDACFDDLANLVQTLVYVDCYVQIYSIEGRGRALFYSVQLYPLPLAQLKVQGSTFWLLLNSDSRQQAHPKNQHEALPSISSQPVLQCLDKIEELL